MGMIDKRLWFGQACAVRYRNWCISVRVVSAALSQGNFLPFYKHQEAVESVPSLSAMARHAETAHEAFCLRVSHPPWTTLSSSHRKAMQEMGSLELAEASIIWGTGGPDKECHLPIRWGAQVSQTCYRGFSCPSILGCVSMEPPDALLLCGGRKYFGVFSKCCSWLWGSAAQGPSCLPPPPQSVPQLLWDGLLYLHFSSRKMGRHNRGRLRGFGDAVLWCSAYWALEAS